MDDFESSGWSSAEGSREYRDTADLIIQQRGTLLRMLGSFYRTFVAGVGRRRILDLGCGDGVLTETLFAQDRQIEATLVDGSTDMLDAAKDRLARFPVTEYREITFDQIIAGNFQSEPFDLVASSFAIHHLVLANKAILFGKILELLRPGGHFVNIDVALADHRPYTDWYFQLWQEWIMRRKSRLALEADMAHVPEEARAKPENHFDTLRSQLEALESTGFVDVECHYRQGLFCIYGGKAPRS